MTRDFGRVELGASRLDTLREDQTVMRFLRSEFDVETRFGGRFVQAIDGQAGGGPAGERDWFFYVNGVWASVGAAEYELSPGDRVQWDLRDWGAADARVGDRGRVPRALPAAGSRASAGRCEWSARKRRPAPARRPRTRSSAWGWPRRAPRSGRRAPSRSRGWWWPAGPRARIVRGAPALEEGPEASGVFARFSADGRRLELLDRSGEVARTVAPGDGTGLVVALRPRDDELLWIVTGLDDAALAAGVRALEEDALRDAFAVAVTGGRVEKLPLGEPMTLVPVYRRRPSALHAARAGVGAAFCVAFALVGALYRHPLILAGALGGILVAGAAAGVGREVGRSLRLALPFALLLAAVNALVYQGGETLLVRGGTFLGRRWDITLEAAAEGAMMGLRIVVLIAALGG